MSIRIGQLGVGAWGKNHCKLLLQMPDASLVGVYHIHDEHGAEAAKLFQTLEFDDLDALLKSVDAVVITAATPMHYELTRRALSQDVHVFVEKPICTTVAEATELTALAGEKGLVLQVGHIERFNPAYRAFQTFSIRPKYIQAERLGLYSARGTDVSVVLDLMIHDIDLVLNLVQCPVERIDATGMANRSSSTDFANARILFTNGCIANLTASRISHQKKRQMQIMDGRWYYKLDFVKRSMHRFNIAGNSASQEVLQNGMLSADSPAVKVHQEENLLQSELAAFIQAIRSKTEPVVDGQAGMRALDIALRIEHAISSV